MICETKHLSSKIHERSTNCQRHINIIDFCLPIYIQICQTFPSILESLDKNLKMGREHS